MDYNGKKILLVGAAPDLYVDNINEYDIVVRINKVLPVTKSVAKITSDRCDVLYAYYKIDPSPHLKKVKELRMRLTPIRFSKQGTAFRRFGDYTDNLKIIDQEYIKKFDFELGCKANTGILAIKEIIDQNPKKLFITGITFYRTGYHEHYRETKSKKEKVLKEKGNIYNHNQDKQLDWFVKNVYKKDFVFTDSTLDEICRERIKENIEKKREKVKSMA